ncbi:MAG: sulfite exporter TauE/SafE family protein [Marinilabilia sp.]
MFESIINPLGTSWGIWFITLASAWLVGVSKSGLKGIAMVTIPVLAHFYGGMASAGILVPFLVFGDMFAIRYYYKSLRWEHIKKLYPYALSGIALALIVGKMITDDQFRHIIAISVLLCLALIFYRDYSGASDGFTQKNWFARTLGVTGGFATMIGNAAGPIFNLYLLSMRLPKKSFIATGAVFYISLNFLKIPLHIVVWDSISPDTLQMNFIMLPAVWIGSITGKWLVRFIPEKEFRIFVTIVITISAVMLFFK